MIGKVVSSSPAALSLVVAPPPRPPAPIQKEIQRITFEMSRLLNEPDYKTSDNIPVKIEKSLNSLTPRQLRLADAKVIFQMKMAEVEDPDAHPIGVHNTIKGDEEACPPFEFIYTNEMYYDKEIGGPDHTNLKGCDCVGSCDPTSKTCSCLARQEYWTAYPDDHRFNGFAYREDGTLKDRSFPVFECNWKCGCDESCINRVRSFLHPKLPDICIISFRSSRKEGNVS